MGIAVKAAMPIKFTILILWNGYQAFVAYRVI